MPLTSAPARKASMASSSGADLFSGSSNYSTAKQIVGGTGNAAQSRGPQHILRVDVSSGPFASHSKRMSKYRLSPTTPAPSAHPKALAPPNMDSRIRPSSSNGSQSSSKVGELETENDGVESGPMSESHVLNSKEGLGMGALSSGKPVTAALVPSTSLQESGSQPNPELNDGNIVLALPKDSQSSHGTGITSTANDSSHHMSKSNDCPSGLSSKDLVKGSDFEGEPVPSKSYGASSPDSSRNTPTDQPLEWDSRGTNPDLSAMSSQSRKESSPLSGDHIGGVESNPTPKPSKRAWLKRQSRRLRIFPNTREHSSANDESGGVDNKEVLAQPDERLPEGNKAATAKLAKRKSVKVDPEGSKASSNPIRE